MSERDPQLQALFAAARRDLPDEGFTDAVMDRVSGLKQRQAIGRIGIDLLLVLLAWLLAEPLQAAVVAMMPGLMASLFEIDNRLLADLLLPVNNVASAVLLAMVALHSVYRRLF